MNILEEIAERTKERVEAQKKNATPQRVKELVAAMSGGDDFPFERALKSDDISFICEVKKASPSKGIISEDFQPVSIAEEYESAGAAAISVLTEPYYFKGSDEYLSSIAKAVKTPLLRKDFTVDEYMIYEAKLLGASAVLLICSILKPHIIAEYINIAHSIGLSALIETHDESEIETALTAGARLIGVNNRNLKTFEVDITLSERLRKYVPQNVLFISESGIKTPYDIARLRAIGADAVLIGETIMKSKDKRKAIEQLTINS